MHMDKKYMCFHFGLGHNWNQRGPHLYCETSVYYIKSKSTDANTLE